MWLLLARPLLGTQPATQACALTGIRASDPLVRRPALGPLSHSSQGIFSSARGNSLVPVNGLGTPVSDPFRPMVYVSVLIAEPRCLDCYSSTVSFEIRRCESFDLGLIFKISFFFCFCLLACLVLWAPL